MTLTANDLKLIKDTLKPEFDSIEQRVKTTLQPEFDKVEHRIKASLQPEFDKVEHRIKASLQPEFKSLEKRLTSKINALRAENRRDHNLIIKTFDERDHQLQKRVKKLEDHTFKPAW